MGGDKCVFWNVGNFLLTSRKEFYQNSSEEGILDLKNMIQKLEYS